MGDSDRHVPSTPAELGPVSTEESRVTTFASLKNRNYLWFWLAMLASFSGQMMQNLARGWLVYEITNSTLALGMVSAGWGVPMILLSIYGGAVTDRVNKRNLLIVTQAATGVIAAIIAVLILVGMIEVWHLMVAAVLNGITFAFNAPGRQAMIPELVPGRELMNAIAVNSMGVNLMRIGAPALAGALIPLIGVSGVYFVSVGLCIAALGALFMISVAESTRGAAATTVTKDAAEGLRYIFRNAVVLSLLALAFVSVLVAMPYMQLMPAFVVDVLKGGAPTLGWLSAVGGTGALIGALVFAIMGNLRKKGLLMLIIAFVFGVMLALFALSRSTGVALLLIFGVGLTNNAYLVLNNTLIQTNVPNWVRGRVMSIHAMTFGMQFLGALPVGGIAEKTGVPLVIGGSGAVVALFVLATAVFYRRLRQME